MNIVNIHLSANVIIKFQRDSLEGMTDFFHTIWLEAKDSHIRLIPAGFDEANLDFIERLGEACLSHVAQHRKIVPPPGFELTDDELSSLEESINHAP